MFEEDDPINFARYAKENDLLDIPGWKKFKRLASREEEVHLRNEAIPAPFFEAIQQIQVYYTHLQNLEGIYFD